MFNSYATAEADVILHHQFNSYHFHRKYVESRCNNPLRMSPLVYMFRDGNRKKRTFWLSLIPMWLCIAHTDSPVCMPGPNTTCYHALSDSSAVLNPGEPLAVLSFAQAAEEMPCIFEDSSIYLELPLDVGSACPSTYSYFTAHHMLLLRFAICIAQEIPCTVHCELYNLYAL